MVAAPGEGSCADATEEAVTVAAREPLGPVAWAADGAQPAAPPRVARYTESAASRGSYKYCMVKKCCQFVYREHTMKVEQYFCK